MKCKAFVFTAILTITNIVVISCVFKSSSSVTTENANGVVSGTPSSGSGEMQIAPPETLVTELYKAHDGKKSPFFQTKDRALVDKYFTKSTSDLIWKDANGSKGEVGALDGDPLYAAQDTEIKNFNVGKGEVKGDAATVAVTFTNYGEKKTVKYNLKLVANTWKIDDIIWPEGDSMVKVFKENFAVPKPETDAASNGEFEGKFTVGETSCIVKPVKMAFEVKWAKGSGVEMFFFKDGNTFESSDDNDDGPNRFEFDDADYTTGTFYRADGKTFPVARSK